MNDSGEEAMRFEVLKHVLKDGASARLGRLTLPRRKVVETPDFFSITSRGVVPHITPDNLSSHVQTAGVYMGLEDFIERSQSDPKRQPPIFRTPPSEAKPLHAYTAMPSSTITVLGPRRFPAVAAPMGNGQNGISVFTSTGFQPLSTKDYESATETLKPDIAIPLADLTPASTTPKPKRAVRMAERTEDWLAQWFNRLDPTTVLKPSSISVFAPILPIPYSLQWEYLNRLSEDHQPALSGLAIYDTDMLPNLTDYSPLLPLPRLSLDEAPTPHEILKQILLGVDIFLLPFLNAASDSGVALTFSFPAPALSSTNLLPLGIDLSSPSHQTSLQPLSPGCTCYTCTSHHRAYVHHLLRAREMLGWTLLQIHNHRVVADFFAGVRGVLSSSDASAAEALAKEKARFAATYETALPRGTGERPRARGYHFKSEGADGKRNRRAWGKLDDAVAGTGAEAEAGGLVVESAEAVAAGVEGLSVGEDGKTVRDSVQTPVVPEEDSRGLGGRGFAEVVGGKENE